MNNGKIVWNTRTRQRKEAFAFMKNRFLFTIDIWWLSFVFLFVVSLPAPPPFSQCQISWDCLRLHSVDLMIQSVFKCVPAKRGGKNLLLSENINIACIRGCVSNSQFVFISVVFCFTSKIKIGTCTIPAKRTHSRTFIIRILMTKLIQSFVASFCVAHIQFNKIQSRRLSPSLSLSSTNGKVYSAFAMTQAKKIFARNKVI